MAQTSSGNAAVARAFSQAEAAERAGDLDAAEMGFRALLAQFPNEPLLMSRLALVLKAKDRAPEAEPLLRRAIALLPAEPSLHNNLGNVLRAQAKLPEAVASYERAIELSPAYAEPHFNKGITLEEQGLPTDAAAAIATAVRLKPDYHQAVTRLAVLAYQQNELDAALGHAEAALRLQPAYFDALYYRALILSAMERHDEALAALQAAGAVRPESFEVALAVANNLQKSGRNDEAVAAFWNVMEKKPDRVATHDDLNRLAWSMGRQDIFLRSFAYAREREGEKADLLFAEAEFRVRRDENQAAEGLLRRAAELAPDQSSISAGLARTLVRQQRYEEGLQLFEQVLRGEPRNALYRNDYGIALLMARDAKRALGLFEQSRVIAPADQMAWAGFCLALRETCDPRYFDLVDFDAYVRSYDIPAPAGYADVGAFNRALAEELLKFHTMKVEPIEQTLRGGSQTPGLLFNARSNLIQSVKSQIEEAVADYVRQLPRDANHPAASRAVETFSFTHSWSCKLRSNGFHTNHVHPMGWISSAYYVHVPDEVDDATARPGWLKFGESSMALGENDRIEKAVKPVVGRLVLFPSFYWHGTVPFTSGSDRLTIAFDVVPGTQASVDPRGPY